MKPDPNCYECKGLGLLRPSCSGHRHLCPCTTTGITLISYDEPATYSQAEALIEAIHGRAYRET